MKVMNATVGKARLMLGEAEAYYSDLLRAQQEKLVHQKEKWIAERVEPAKLFGLIGPVTRERLEKVWIGDIKGGFYTPPVWYAENGLGIHRLQKRKRLLKELRNRVEDLNRKDIREFVLEEDDLHVLYLEPFNL